MARASSTPIVPCYTSRRPERLRADRTGPPVLDHERGPGVRLRARAGDAAHRSQVGAQPLSCDLHAHVAAPGAVAETDMRIVGQQRVDLRLRAPELRRDGRADDPGGHAGL